MSDNHCHLLIVYVYIFLTLYLKTKVIKTPLFVSKQAVLVKYMKVRITVIISFI